VLISEATTLLAADMVETREIDAAEVMSIPFGSILIR
jgi:hypothetical protein